MLFRKLIAAFSESRMKQHVSKSQGTWMLKLMVPNRNYGTLKDTNPQSTVQVNNEEISSCFS
jgi:hypothetical protein